MDTDLMLMLAAGCIAVLFIAFSAKLVGRSKGKPKAGPSQNGASSDGNNLFEQFKRMAAEQPNNAELWLKWGKELSAAASTAKHPNMRLHRYNEACACFQSATGINPALTVAWQNWGQTLYSIYRLQSCEGRLLLDNAHTKFQTAIRLSPADSALWQHWGEELYLTASYCQSQEHKQELRDLADAKFAKAVQINPGLMLEWKKWRGEGDNSRFSEQDMLLAASAAEKSGQTGASAAAPEESQRPEPSLPWTRGSATPAEASAWLTQDASPTQGAANKEQQMSQAAPVDAKP